MQVFNFLWPSKGKKQDETFYGLCARCPFALQSNDFLVEGKSKQTETFCVCWPFTLSILTPVGDFPRLLTTEQVVTGLFVDDDEDVKQYKLQCIVMLYWYQSKNSSLALRYLKYFTVSVFYNYLSDISPRSGYWDIHGVDSTVQWRTKKRTFQKASQVPIVPWKVLKSTKAQSI